MIRFTPCRLGIPRIPAFLVLAGLLMLLTPVSALAVEQPFRILLDDDNDTATGCTVATADGNVDGVDQLLLITLDIQIGSAQVIGHDRQVCSAGMLVADPIVPPPPVPWNVGLGLGVDGSDVVEAYLPLDLLTPGNEVLFGVASGSGGMSVGADALLGLGPIVIEEQGFQPEIPTLGEWGLLLLATLLALLALSVLRHRRSVALSLLALLALGSAVGLVWASVPDGLINDWMGISELGLDPIGEPLNEDLRAAFAQVSGSQLCLRFDVFLQTDNEAPDAVDDAFAVDEDSSGNVLDVLANDTDADSDPLTITSVGTPDQGGTATTDGSTITYTPAPDFKGTETFTYTIEDPAGGSDTATVTVTVNNVNDDPDAVDDAFAVDEDSTDNPLDVLANDTDAPDMNETLTITAVGMPDQGGSVSITGGGIGLSYSPAMDFAGVETFTYTIEDGNGGMDTATVTVTVSNDNDLPVATDDAFAVDEDSMDASLDVLANDSFAPDVGETLTITAVGMTDQGGTATTDGSTITYTPAANFVGVETFTYTISDGNGGSDMATVTVTVANTNMDPPVCAADSAMTDEDNSTVVDVLANDTDPDPGQTATLTVLGVNIAGTAGTVTNNGTDVTYDPNGQFDFLDDGEMDTDTFTYTAQDTDGLTCMATVTVTITGINDVPMVVNEIFDVAMGNFDPAIGNTTLQFSNTETVTTPHRFVSGDVLDNDSDVENDPLTITAFDAMSTEGGTVSFNLATGEFIYLPPVGFEGDDSFTYTVSDGTDTAMGTVSIEVADMVWYIDNDPANDGSGDDGRSSSPFNTIAQFEAENGNGGLDDPEAGDIIFIFQGTSTYDAGGGDIDGIDLLDQQKLLGEGVDLIVQSLTLVSGNAANQPSIDNTNVGGDAVTVLANAADRTGIEIRGLSINGTGNAIEITSANTFQVGATISDNTIAGSGTEGVDLNPGSSGAFVVLMENNVFSTASATGTAIDLTTAAASGDVEIALNANTDVTSSGGAGIVLDNSAGGGDLFITGFSGNTVHGNTLGDGIRILNATFDADPGDPDFTGDEVSGGDTTVGVGNPVGGSAMVLTNVAGDLAFGTLSLSTDGMGAVGLDVTGNGLINAVAGTGFEISSTGGTVSSTNGPAVILDPLTAGLTLSSVSSASSSTTGVSLTDIAGTFSAAAGSITGSAGTSFNVNGGTPSVIYNGSITHGGNASRTIEIQSMTGGSASFGGAVSATDGTGIRIANNTGTNSVSFTSTVDLGTGVNRISDGDAFTMTGNSAATTVSASDLDVFTNGVQGVVASGSGILGLDALSLNTTGNGGRALNLAGIQSLVDVDTATCSNNSDCVTLSSLAASSNTTFAGVGLTCSGGTCFNASAARTVEVAGNGNTISATSAVGLNMTNTTIGANDATFESISASGAANGIVLATTGSTGAFEVTGTGTTDASGGTIQTTTGDAVTANNVRGGLNLSNMVLGDASAMLGQAKDATNNVGGDGIDLVGVDDVVLANMRIARTNNHGIDGTDVTDFAISDSEIFNAGDDNGDSGISFEGVGSNNLDGTATVTNTIVDGAVEFGMRVQNSSGTLGLMVSGSQFSGTANTGALMFGEDGLQIEVLGTAQTTARIHNNSTFSMLESDGIMGTTGENGAAVLNLTIEGNTFTGFDNGAPSMRSDNAIELNATGGTNAANSPDLRYTISGNTINSSSNSAILIGANDFTNVDGRITGNVITGSLFGFGIEAPLSADDNSVARLLVTGNTITNHNQQGAFFNANNSGDLDITFTGNMVTTQPTDPTAFENVLFQITAGTLCVEASGNTIALGGADAFGPGVAADALGMIRTGGTAQLEVGSANLADPASTVLSTNNPAAASVFTAGAIGVVANGTCVAPIVTPVP